MVRRLLVPIFVAALVSSACSGGSNKCAAVVCPAGTMCDPMTGACLGAVGGGSGATGGGSGTAGGTGSTAGGTGSTAGGSGTGGGSGSGGGSSATGGGSGATGGGSGTGGGSAGSGGGSAGSGGATGRNITITTVDTYYSATGQTTQVFNAPNPPRAIQVQGATQNVFMGSWLDAGYGVIPNVPAGRLMIFYGGAFSYVDTTQDSIDIGAEQPGRANVALAAANTRVFLRVSGVSPWAPGLGDFIYYNAPNVGSDYSVQTATDAGSTFFDAGINFVGRELLNASLGDTLLLAQYRYEVVAAPGADAGRVLSLRPENHVTPLNNVTYINAFDNFVAATLSPTVRGQSINLDWRRAEFAALVGQVNPSATIDDAFVNVVELPFGATLGHGHVSGSMSQVLLAQVVAPNFTDFTNCTATVSYARLYPPFPLSANVYMQYGNNYPLVGGQMARVTGFVFAQDAMPNFVTNPQRPIVTPPTNVMVDGVAATGPISLTTLTPTVSWTAPTGAIAYQVDVYRFFTAPMNGVSYDQVGRIFTNATSITLPQGVMAAQNRYALRIRAIAEPSGDPVNAPFRRGSWPLGLADALTGPVIQP